jgi:hypothetical protein
VIKARRYRVRASEGFPKALFTTVSPLLDMSKMLRKYLRKKGKERKSEGVFGDRGKEKPCHNITHLQEAKETRKKSLKSGKTLFSLQWTACKSSRAEK